MTEDTLVIDYILDESKWLPTAFVASILVVTAQIKQLRNHSRPGRLAANALNLFYGCLIGVMAVGHLLAVSIKYHQGSLEGDLVLLYGLGLALAVPAWWMVLHLARRTAVEIEPSRRTAGFNAWLVLCLVSFGLHNAPLATPGALNILLSFYSGSKHGTAILTVAIVAYAVLFVGSLVFLASGGSFEQFRGIA